MALNSMTSKDVSAILAKHQIKFYLLQAPTRYYVLRQYHVIGTHVNSVKSTEEMVDLLRKRYERPLTKNKAGHYVMDYFKIIAATDIGIEVIYGKKCTWRELRVIKDLKKKYFRNN